MNKTLEVFNRAFLSSYDSLKRFAAQIVGDFKAGDVVHDVYLKLVDDEYISKVGNFKAYLFKSVKNRALRAAVVAERESSLDALVNSHQQDTLKCMETPPIVEAKIINEPSKPRDVALMNLYKTGKKWYLKAPEVLGISPEAARVRMSRLLTKLQKESA